MRNCNIFSTVLSLFLLVPASITWAQTISTQKGLTTAEFKLQWGTIKVYLPEDIQPGDLISGTVLSEPLGKNSKQVEKNLAELSKGYVFIGGKKILIPSEQTSFQWLVPGEMKTDSPIEIIYKSRSKQTTLTIPLKKEPPGLVDKKECSIPAHALVNAPFRIKGNFDGNSTNTQCNLDGKHIDVLAESPRQTIVHFPKNDIGQQTLIIKDNNENTTPMCRQTVSNVRMDIVAGSLDLKKGEQTYIEVTIYGLKHIPDTALLTLQNLSSDVVTMLPSNNVAIPILPDSVTTGFFKKRFVINSFRQGSFHVNVNLDLPENAGNTDAATGDNAQSTCACEAGCTISEIESKGGLIRFKAEVKAGCKGFSGRGNTKVVCGVTSITYKWSIGKSGADIAEINGPDDAAEVNIKMKKEGSYNLYLNGIVTCSDGSTCAFHCNVEKTAHPPTTAECGLSYQWCAGPAIRLKNHGYYPSGEAILKQYRPGDLLGLSVLAEDLDILVQRCLCPEGLSVKHHAPSPDKLEYDWKLVNFENGHGNFVNHTGSEANSVLYQLPYCYQQFPIYDKITVTIKNSGGKAMDDSIQVLFTIRVFIPSSKFKEEFVVERKLNISVTKTILHTAADVRCEKEEEGDCIVQPLKWEEGSKLTKTASIELKRPGDRPPDNLIVLQAFASDNDNLTLTCYHKKTGATIEEKVPGLYDDCIYTWTIIEGKGSFPLGNQGQAVVFKQDYGEANKVIIRCDVTDSKTQFMDTNPPSSEAGLEPRIKPIALVGVGSLLYLGMKDGHGELFEAGKKAVKNYEKAGYKVDFRAELTSADLETVIKTNAYQAILLLGHGNEIGFIDANGVSFNPSDVGSWTFDKWRCSSTLTNNKQPLIQELILLGCNMGKAYWFRNFFSLPNYFVRYEWVWSSAFYSSVKEYVEEKHKPLAPRIVDP